MLERGECLDSAARSKRAELTVPLRQRVRHHLIRRLGLEDGVAAHDEHDVLPTLVHVRGWIGMPLDAAQSTTTIPHVTGAPA